MLKKKQFKNIQKKYSRHISSAESIKKDDRNDVSDDKIKLTYHLNKKILSTYNKESFKMAQPVLRRIRTT